MLKLSNVAQQKGFKCTLLIENHVNYSGNTSKIFLGKNSEGSLSLIRRTISPYLPPFLKSLYQKQKKYFNFYKYEGVYHEKRVNLLINIHKIKEQEILKLLQNNMPKKIYLAGDRHDGYELAILKVAKQLKIRIIIPPIAEKVGYEGPLLQRRKNLNYGIIVTEDITFKKKYKNIWMHDKVSKEDISFYPKWDVVAKEKCGVLPKNPWIIGSSGNLICAHGELEKKLIINDGVDPDNIIVTGHLDHDILYDIFANKKKNKLRKNLYSKYSLNPNKPMILIGVPQLLEHFMMPAEEHWTFQETLCKESTKTNSNILLSLHPKMRYNDYKFLQNKYQVKIISEKITEILPLSDIYLGIHGSSTIPLALLCEIPIIILDPVELNYTIYDWIKSKFVIKDLSNLFSTLNTLINDKKILKEIKLAHKSQKNSVSPFDGKCQDRIFNI
tara:strand:+ start:1034 stop:2359 length:1326 start_codon:yes stop_codon:yes gene_type:complete